MTKWFVLAAIYNMLIDWKSRKFDPGWQAWIPFLESHQFEKFIDDYAPIAFKITWEILPKRVEPRDFFKSKDASKKFRSRVSIRKFESNINKAYQKFKNEN